MKIQSLDQLPDALQAEPSDKLCRGNYGDKETLEEIIKSLIEVVSTLSQKMDRLDEGFNRIEYISKKINEIHSLHFPKDALEKEKNLTEKFLAEILLGIPRKRKK
ncbi:hypothetical protein GM921_00385 [Pedobacter sp. LMG 31464]|uniref:Uncharacterized protein n=1 Tax=Pedobacter planticolens TaxID=2679964 RepID=A0A923ITN3_9SPHI|nr:hypothetical protein [Pedobacter planticolens]MBB2143926.1 hypothetical protein [Pedobacter planticolens]